MLGHLSGQSGRMSMFLWDHSNPWRDGSLENSILIHEVRLHEFVLEFH